MPLPPLTPNQERVLAALKSYGRYPAGWCIGTPAKTHKTLRALVARGLAHVDADNVFKPMIRHSIVRYKDGNPRNTHLSNLEVRWVTT